MSTLRRIFKTNRPELDTTRSQHYAECDNCETGPAQYFCKSCQGKLCDNCKQSHGEKRLTQDHVVVSLHEYKSDPFECHEGKKSKCACTIKKRLKEEMSEIDEKWLPFLAGIKEDEKNKKTVLAEKVSEIEIEITEHFDQIIQKFTNIKEVAIQSLKGNKNQASEEIDNTILEIEESTGKLKSRKQEIEKMLKYDDEDMDKNMCRKINEAKLTPRQSHYEVEKFCPGSIENKTVEQMFGKCPVIHRPETIPHNRFFNWVATHLDKSKQNLF